MEMLKMIIGYVYIAFLAFEIIAICVFFVLKLIKRHKAKKEEASEVDMLNKELKLSHEAVDSEKALNKLISVIIPASMEMAEKSGIIGGELKKTLALSKCMLMCVEEHIDWPKVADFVSAKMEELIEFSKAVNRKGR